MKLPKLLICLLTFTILCGCQKVPDSGVAASSSVSQPAPAASAGSTVEYRLPQISQWIIGISSYEELSAHLDSQESPLPNLDPKFGTARLEGNYLLLKADETQKKAVLDAASQLLPQCCEPFKSVSPLNYVEWSEDFSSLTFGFDYKVLLDKSHQIGTLWDISSTVIVELIVCSSRILLTGDCDAPILLIYKNPESGHLLDSTFYPYESSYITDKDWEKSFSEDILVHSDKPNERYMKMELREIQPDFFIFAPLEKEPYFSNDELVAVRRVEDGKKVIYAPYQFRVGDIVFLRVDGTYADITNNGNILPINCSAIVPERYFDLKEQSFQQ